MNAQVDQHPAFLIHSRNYSDSRTLVELLTRDHGRVSAVRRFNRKSLKHYGVQAFTPLIVSWSGKTALKTLVLVEAAAAPITLRSDCLYCGFYLNEVIQRCLPQDDPCEAVYDLYHRTLQAIASSGNDRPLLEACLREFELELLEALGFGIDFYSDVSGAEITEGAYYRFVEGEGFHTVMESNPRAANIFPAAALRAIREHHFNRETLPYAKRLCRQAMTPLLGSRPLKSRELFVK